MNTKQVTVQSLQRGEVVMDDDGEKVVAKVGNGLAFGTTLVDFTDGSWISPPKNCTVAIKGEQP